MTPQLYLQTKILHGPVFSSPVQVYRKSYCTTPGVGIGVDKMLKFNVKVFQSDRQGSVRRAVLYTDRPYVVFEVVYDTCEGGVLIVRQDKTEQTVFAQISLSQY